MNSHLIVDEVVKPSCTKYVVKKRLESEVVKKCPEVIKKRLENEVGDEVITKYVVKKRSENTFNNIMSVTNEIPHRDMLFKTAVNNYKKIMEYLIVENINNNIMKLNNNHQLLLKNIGIYITYGAIPYKKIDKVTEKDIKYYSQYSEFDKKCSEIYVDVNDNNYIKANTIHYGEMENTCCSYNTDFTEYQFDKRKKNTWSSYGITMHPFREIQLILREKNYFIIDVTDPDKREINKKDMLKSFIVISQCKIDIMANHPLIHGLNNVPGILLKHNVEFKIDEHIISPTHEAQEMYIEQLKKRLLNKN